MADTQRPDLTEAHSNLVEKNKDYRAAVSKSAIDRVSEYPEEINAKIDELLVKTNRNYELHFANVDFVTGDPFSENPKEFIESEDDNIVIIVCDNGILLIGDNIDFGCYWDDIKLIMAIGKTKLVIQLSNGGQLLIEDDYIPYIIEQLFRAYQDMNPDVYIFEEI